MPGVIVLSSAQLFSRTRAHLRKIHNYTLLVSSDLMRTSQGSRPSLSLGSNRGGSAPFQSVLAQFSVSISDSTAVGCSAELLAATCRAAGSYMQS